MYEVLCKCEKSEKFVSLKSIGATGILMVSQMLRHSGRMGGGRWEGGEEAQLMQTFDFCEGLFFFQTFYSRVQTTYMY